MNNNSALNQEIKLKDIAYGGKQRGRAEEMWRFDRVDIRRRHRSAQIGVS